MLNYAKLFILHALPPISEMIFICSNSATMVNKQLFFSVIVLVTFLM